MRYKEVYDRLYEAGYHKSVGTNHGAELVEMIKRDNAWRSSVLDIGCSKGSALKSLKEVGFDVYGIDIADIAIQGCHKRGLSNCKVASCANIEFNDNVFDVVMSSDVFEHIDKDELELSAKEIYRVMKPGAKFYFKICVRLEQNRNSIYYDQILKGFNGKGELRKKYERQMKNLHVTVEKKKFWIDLFTRHGLVSTQAKMAWETSPGRMKGQYSKWYSPPNPKSLSRLTEQKRKLVSKEIREWNKMKALMDKKSKNLIITGYKK
tara:strand:- start:302 stop:1093 length:792 start_codon:yes stop_codon:yes gene_type:complete